MEVVRRDELEEPYLHPYRYWLPVAWRLTRSPQALAGAVAAVPISVLLHFVVGGEGAFVILGIIVFLVGLAFVLQSLAQAAWEIRKITRGWDQPSELTDVRRNRPHAGEHDPIDPDSVLAPGRPMYAADVVAEREFDAADASRAAEQLSSAQEDAATRERAAIADAQRRAIEAVQHAELSAERASTAAALQHLTGQHRR